MKIGQRSEEPLTLEVTGKSGQKHTIVVPANGAYAVITSVAMIKRVYSSRKKCTYWICIANTGESLYLESTPGHSLEPLPPQMQGIAQDIEQGEHDFLLVVGRQMNGYLEWGNQGKAYRLPKGALAPLDVEDNWEVERRVTKSLDDL